MALSIITQGLGTFGDVHHVITWGLLPGPITSTITQLCFEVAQIFAPSAVGQIFFAHATAAIIFAPGCVGQIFFPRPVAADTFVPGHATAAQIGCGCNC